MRARPVLKRRKGRALLTTYSPASSTNLAADIFLASYSTTPTTSNLVAGQTYWLEGPYDRTEDGLPDVDTDAGNPVTINGNGAIIARDPTAPNFRLLEVHGKSLTLNNLTLEYGSLTSDDASFGGGALLDLGATVSLNGVTLTGNQVFGTANGPVTGGGIGVVGGALSLDGSTIAGNSAYTSYGTLTQVGSDAYGGGVYDEGGTVNISGGPTFGGNQAAGQVGGGGAYGGGLYGGGGTVNIAGGTTFSGNLAVGGAGVQGRTGADGSRGKQPAGHDNGGKGQNGGAGSDGSTAEAGALYLTNGTGSATLSPVNALAVNCTPWSVLKTSGLPDSNASSSISVQNEPSSVFDSLPVITYRLYQSITSARSMNPEAIGMSVMSVLQT